MKRTFIAAAFTLVLVGCHAERGARAPNDGDAELGGVSEKAAAGLTPTGSTAPSPADTIERREDDAAGQPPSPPPDTGAPEKDAPPPAP